MSGSVLFLRADDNDFEKYVTRNIISEGYDVAMPYTVPMEKIYNLPLFDKICFKLKTPILYKHLIGDWKHSISEYDLIIIFDKALTPQLLRYIKRYNSECRLKIWLWNCRYLEDEVLQYADVYTFDEDYAALKGYKYVPQFHFRKNFSVNHAAKPGVYYIGYDKGRLNELTKVAKILNDIGIRHNLILRKDPDIDYRTNNRTADGIRLIDKDMDYCDILDQMRDYSCVLELNIKEQYGLTLRSLEALFSEKKLITNNTKIATYDFYNPENIFILGKDDVSELKSFLGSGYCPVAQKIKESYTFEKWIGSLTEDL